MELLNKWLSEYAAYFGIMAAILALGSWLTTNYFGNRANSARDALRNAEISLSNSRNFRRIYGLVDQETQNLDHVYTLLRDLSLRTAENESSAQHIAERQRYDTLKRLEYTRHGDRLIQSELERADQLVEYANILNVEHNLVQRATTIREEIRRLFERRRTAHESLRKTIKASGDLYKLTETEWRQLAAEIENYRVLVEITTIPEQNRASERVAALESEIFQHQKGEADRRKRIAKILSRIALALYVASGLLAVYGKWLEVKYTKKKDSPVMSSNETAGTVERLSKTSNETNRAK